jgi:hypothetical protein
MDGYLLHYVMICVRPFDLSKCMSLASSSSYAEVGLTLGDCAEAILALSISICMSRWWIRFCCPRANA